MTVRGGSTVYHIEISKLDVRVDQDEPPHMYLHCLPTSLDTAWACFFFLCVFSFFFYCLCNFFRLPFLALLRSRMELVCAYSPNLDLRYLQTQPLSLLAL